MVALLLGQCVRLGLVAQDIPPPPPDFYPDTVTWTRFTFVENGFGVTMVSDSVHDTTTVWHVGRTRFIAALGVWPTNSAEHTQLHPSLAHLSLDSLARLYWKPRTGRYTISVSDAPALDGHPVVRVLLTNKINGSLWSALMMKPDPTTLLTLTAQFDKSSGSEREVVEKYFGSLRLLPK